MAINFDRALIEKCQTNAPRYTSYPTADRFSPKYTVNEQLQQINQVFNQVATPDKIEPISLYIHIPFCNTLCLFCACNKIITNDRSKIDNYLDYLEREIKLYHQLIGRKLEVVQLHFGGGSPSWMDKDQLTRVMDFIRQYFILDNAHEIAMEIDPRHCDKSYIKHLKSEGFTRISLGIQDFNPQVQKSVNRIQSFEQSNAILAAAKECDFKSTNVDLIYGLPFQSLASFTQTIDSIINMKPERIALFNYAHVPSTAMPQTRISESDLPVAQVKLDILQMSVERLTAAGYVFIGMDHFALPDDDLAIALTNNNMQRNFQGYSTFKDTHMLAFGVSAIGFIGNSYYQNSKDLTSYYMVVDNKQLPILRGYILSDDDVLRRDIIQNIMCQFALDFEAIAGKYAINFKQYFADELMALDVLSQLELIEFTANGFVVTAKGHFLIRNVAVVFDKYLRLDKDKTRYSKVI